MLHVRSGLVPEERIDVRMKRFACHRLYISPGKCCAQGVVELGEDGRVCGYFPLEEEISATQWIGGVILLSSKDTLEREGDETFRSFLQRATEGPGKGGYAWHISGFNLQEEEFTAQSRLVRL